MQILVTSPNNPGTQSLISANSPLQFFIVHMVKETEAQKSFYNFPKEYMSGNSYLALSSNLAVKTDFFFNYIG